MLNMFFALIILGVFQGITEFLPISSSGHLALLEQTDIIKCLMGGSSDEINLLINVSLHVATLIAVLIYMRNEIFIIIKGFFTGLIKRDFSNPDFLSGIYIIIASIPAGIIGFFLHKYIEAVFSSITIILVFLIINGFVLIAANKIPSKDRKFKELGIFRSIMVGLCQAVAILPGISRSGATLAGGLLCGLEGVEAARFSFLMAIPVIAGAGLLEGLKAAGGSYPSDIFLPVLAGMFTAIIVALVSIRVLFWIVKNVKLDIFGYYTIALGVSGLIFKFLILN
jgi:undecaprenyl-diphosphatase